MTEPLPTDVDFGFETSEGIVEDPWGYWDVLRKQHGNFRTSHADVIGPTWVFTGYDAVYAGLRNYELFSSETVTVNAEIGAHRWIPEELDPPEHTKYRQILAADFAPGPIAAMEGEIRDFCNELIDAFVDTGGVEVYAQFARRFPTEIFMRLMGLPVERADELLDKVHALMHNTNESDPDGSQRMGAAGFIYGLLHETFADRRANPRDDLMTKLVQATIDGEPMSEPDLGEYGFLLYMAGLDTVAGVIALMLKHLAENDDDRQFIVDDASRIPAAVEELLRYYAIVTTGRVVTRDEDFHGCPMKKGERALFSTLSANRDPSFMADADKVVLDRSPNRHISFGLGPHRCLGSNLARLELTVLMQEWHRRIPKYRVVDADQIQTHAGGVSGMDRLHLAW